MTRPVPNRQMAEHEINAENLHPFWAFAASVLFAVILVKSYISKHLIRHLSKAAENDAETAAKRQIEGENCCSRISEAGETFDARSLQCDSV